MGAKEHQIKIIECLKRMIPDIFDKPLLIFSDLDGTLLDHDTYRFDEAAPALNRLTELEIPLILNSSKTAAEIIDIRHALLNEHPFIAENGSIVMVPENYFEFKLGSTFKKTPYPGLFQCQLGGDRGQILEVLHGLRKDHGFSFTGFHDMTVRQLSDLTGLSLDEARLAGQRLSTEPLVWEDENDRLDVFLNLLSHHGLQAVQGGRFLSVSRPFDKKDGVAVLMDLYTKQSGEELLYVGLGDSPNDAGMLEMMDIAVIIKSGQSDRIYLNNPDQRIIKTDRTGPGGWQEAMDRILRREL